jgi:uncharacterized protein YegP (UPF0339 family)
MRFELDTNINGAYFFRLVADNGNILASSEAYSSKTKCVQTLKSIAKEFGLRFDKYDLVAEITNDN